MPTVLLVDDDLENRWALQLALESRGHRVVLAENGCDALQKARAVLPQLIITDLQMPEMNGAELCRHLKCGAAFSGVPVLLLSAMPEPTAGIRCWTAYLRKPVSMEELLDTVDMFIAARLTYGRALGDSEPPPQPAGEPSTRDVGPERTLIAAAPDLHLAWRCSPHGWSVFRTAPRWEMATTKTEPLIRFSGLIEQWSGVGPSQLSERRRAIVATAIG
ncbi:response regulator [Paraburkholderia youngii]|uniref:response regulator n=1 Tax=Paraburkholderia youngii TaxID=2782701 RepID=UPI003D193520